MLAENVHKNQLCWSPYLFYFLVFMKEKNVRVEIYGKECHENYC